MAKEALSVEHGAHGCALQTGHSALRKGRWCDAGRVYLITTTTKHRQPLFLDPRTAHIAARSLADPLTWGAHGCLCWVLMPDHWHGLLRLGDEGDLATAMHRAKLRSAHAVRRSTGRQGGLWAPSFHDHALRQDEDLLATARYIITNPLRAGLVDDILDYPYWDAAWLDQPSPRVL